MVGALKAHQGDALPIIAGFLACLGVRGGDVGPGPGKIVRLKGPVIPADKAVHAAAVHDLHLDHILGLLGFIVLQHHIDMDGGIQDGVVSIRPKGQDLIRRKALESQLPVLVVVGKHPALAANPGPLTNVVHGPLKAGPKHGGESRSIGLVLRVKGKRPPKRIVGFLVHHLGIDVVDQPVVGQVVQHLDLAVIVQGNALAAEHILGPVIVGLTRKLPLALFGAQPGRDFKLQKALVRHAPAEICGRPGHAVIPQIKHHHRASPPLLADRMGGGIKSNGPGLAFLQGEGLPRELHLNPQGAVWQALRPLFDFIQHILLLKHGTPQKLKSCGPKILWTK